MVQCAKQLGRMKKEWLSPHLGELGWVCCRQDNTAGQLWDFDAGVWFLSPYWLLYVIFSLSVVMASSQLWVECSALIMNRALLLYCWYRPKLLRGCYIQPFPWENCS